MSLTPLKTFRGFIHGINVGIRNSLRLGLEVRG